MKNFNLLIGNAWKPLSREQMKAVAGGLYDNNGTGGGNMDDDPYKSKCATKRMKCCDTHGWCTESSPDDGTRSCQTGYQFTCA